MARKARVTTGQGRAGRKGKGTAAAAGGTTARAAALSGKGNGQGKGNGKGSGNGRGRALPPDGEQRSHASPWARPDSADAFIADPGDGRAFTADDLAEELAEEFVRSATTGEHSDEGLEEVVPEELGGPFVETSAREEFAQGIDGSNPADAEAEPLPRAVGALSQRPTEDLLVECEDGAFTDDERG